MTAAQSLLKIVQSTDTRLFFSEKFTSLACQQIVMANLRRDKLREPITREKKEKKKNYLSKTTIYARVR